jgi:hypothetical protein
MLFDFFYKAFGHEAVRYQLDSGLAHLAQEVFSAIVNEANTRQVNKSNRFRRGISVPALFQFLDTNAG